MDRDWIDEQKAKHKNEREELDKKMAALETNVEALVIEEKQLKAAMEREQDAEEDAKFQRLEELTLTSCKMPIRKEASENETIVQRYFPEG